MEKIRNVHKSLKFFKKSEEKCRILGKRVFLEELHYNSAFSISLGLE